MAEILRTITDTLNLTESAVSNIIAESVSDSISISETFSHNSIDELITDTLNLSSEVRQIYLNVSDSISFQETDNSSVKDLTNSDTLNVSDEINLGRPIYASFRDRLRSLLADIDLVDYNLDGVLDGIPYDIGLDDSIFINTVLNILVSDFIELTDQINTAIPISLIDVLPLSETITNVAYNTVIDVLQLNETITEDVLKPINDTLTLTDGINLDGIYPKSTSDTINLQDVVSYTLTNTCFYGLGVGAGNFDYPAPTPQLPDTIPEINSDGIRFTYPFISPTLTLDLRNPNLDNVTQLEQRRISRRSRGGTLQVFRDNAWPASERLILTFSVLKETDRASLFNFLDKSLGKEVGYVDHENKQWRGVILTPSAQTSQPGKKSFSASIEFEGLKV